MLHPPIFLNHNTRVLTCTTIPVSSHVQRISESETLLRNDFNIVVPRALASTAMDMIEKAETVTADRIVKHFEEKRAKLLLKRVGSGTSTASAQPSQ